MTSRSAADTLLCTALLLGVHAAAAPDPAAGLHIDSLQRLSIDALRARSYGATLNIEQHVSGMPRTYLASFRSDGLREFVRIDVPEGPMPPEGYPIVVFLHGWAGIEAAPHLDFYTAGNTDYGRLIETFSKAGFVVLTPGFRGHGSVGGRVADGIGYLAAWDNGSYVSPVFYAIDVLNLLEGLGSLERVTWPRWGIPGKLKLDRGHVGVIGHSQGGDVALMVLAVSGAGSPLKTAATAGSIWSGCFPPRLTQAAVYHPMETTAQAFLAGDGQWNHTAVGKDGSVNVNFVFGYPPDWIETPDVSRWTWQRKVWVNPTVESALRQRLDEMYATFNERVADLRGTAYTLSAAPDGRVTVAHDPRVMRALERVGAYPREDLLGMPLSLHHSDRDFYSWPAWNADLCARANRAGGHCHDYTYPGNTHSLRLSGQAWFSGSGNSEGFGVALARDVALFAGRDPDSLPGGTR